MNKLVYFLMVGFIKKWIIVEKYDRMMWVLSIVINGGRRKRAYLLRFFSESSCIQRQGCSFPWVQGGHLLNEDLVICCRGKSENPS
jgi:hypothetical protein